MDISLRLKTVANTVRFKTMADIGTDHGYVPIYLAKNGYADKAIACDINPGPLKKAEENILKNNLGGKIETRLGGGLEPIAAGEVETVVIAGMGGMLTINILEHSSTVVHSVKQLVLSPHLDIDKVRKYIHSIGFKIESEEMLVDEGKYYTIISAVCGKEEYDTEIDYLFGKINLDEKSIVLKKYLTYKLKQFQAMQGLLLEANTENSRLKAQQTCEKMLLYKEALNRYEMQ